MRPVALKQSDRIRNAHRLGEITDAQKGMEKLEGELKKALEDVLKTHGLKLRNLSVNLNLKSASGKPLYYDDQLKGPSGFFNGSIEGV